MLLGIFVKIGNPDSSVHHFLIAIGTVLAGFAALLSCLILWLQLGALKIDVRRQAELLDQPMLTFSEVVTAERAESSLAGTTLTLRLSLKNIGTGIAEHCGIFYVDTLPVQGLDLPHYDEPDEARKLILSDYSLTEQHIKNALRYQRDLHVSRVNLRVGAGVYEFTASRALTGRAESFSLYCAVFYESGSGKRRLATAWYDVGVDSGGNVSVSPVHLAYVDDP